MIDLEFANLLSIYGGLLTKNQLDIARSYYDYDLSVTETAENKGVSRQSISDALGKVKNQLLFFESKIKLLEKIKKVKALNSADTVFKQSVIEILEEN